MPSRSTGGRGRRKEKLDRGLDPYSFEICVPMYCDFDGKGPFEPPDKKTWKDDAKERWEEYLDALRKEFDLPKVEPGAPDCCSYFEQPEPADKKSTSGATENCGWKLQGAYAIAHARRVHARLHRQFLRFSHVSAVDVGFAVIEESNVFENRLALRVHVAPKRPTHLLRESSIPSFSNLCYLTAGLKEKPTPSSPRTTTEVRDVSVAIKAAGRGAPGDGRKTKGAMVDPWGCEPPFKLVKCLRDRCYEKSKPIPGFERYPVAGIRRQDLSAHHRETRQGEPRGPEGTCDGWRLCLFGVPIDIVDARYFPSQRRQDDSFDRGVYTDPLQTSVEMPAAEALYTGRGRVEPLVGGVSIGSEFGHAGTLGVVVWDRTDGTPCILSNWHVMAGSASASVGQPIYQPAQFDGGTGADVVAHLKRWHLGNLGDAALAELNGERAYASGEILGLWCPVSRYMTPRLGMRIRKWGRTSGFSKGFIDGIDLATNIDYGGGNVRYFKHQIHIAPLFRGEDVSRTGDSGSLVLTSLKPARLSKFFRDLRALKDPAEREKCLKLWDEIRKMNDEDDEDDDLRVWDENPPAPSPGGDASQQQEIDILRGRLEKLGADPDAWEERLEQETNRSAFRVYYAVGLIFAGDTPGSPFGEFALASDISLLAEEMQFSLRPVFEPRSSFRKLRSFEREGNRRPGGGPRRDRLSPDNETLDRPSAGIHPEPKPIGT